MRKDNRADTFRHSVSRAIVLVMLVGSVWIDTEAADWPMWRYDAGRTAASPEELPDELHLLWTRELPPPLPAFPHDNRLRFDISYEPVVLGKTMFVPCMVTDTLTALDTNTGEQKWVFFADGPVRMAPVAWRDKVYFVSDDGYLYCQDAATGRLCWKYTPVPPKLRTRKVLGHQRLVSRWPARGGPVLADGVIYFGAGVFPFEGVWVCAVDAESGQPVWVNGDCALIKEANQDHGGAWDAGLSPQGYLAIVGDKLAVASGRALPALFDPRTGTMEPYSMGWGGRTGLAKGSWYVASVGQYFFHSGDLYGPKPQVPEPRLPAGGCITLAELAEQTGSTLERVRGWMRDLGIAVVERDGRQCVPLRNWGMSHLYWTGTGPRRDRERQVQQLWPRLQIDPSNDRRSLGPFREPVLAPEAIYYSRTHDAWLKKKDKPVHEIVAYDLRQPLRWQLTFIQGMDVPPRDLVPWKTVAFKHLWSLPCTLKVHIKAGSRLYCGAAGVVAAVDIPDSSGKPHISWQAEIEGTPSRMLAADGKLFVVTQQGAIYAFGGTRRQPIIHKLSKPVATQSSESSARQAARVLEHARASRGYALVLGVGSGHLVEELARQSDLHVIVLEPQADRAAPARRKFHRMGLYGTRVHVIIADLASVELPPYLASVTIWQEPERLDSAKAAPLLDRLFAALRPYGGTACLPASMHTTVARWLEQSRPAGAQLDRADDSTLLRRVGALADSADWTHEAGGPGNTFSSADQRVKPPLAVLWFGGALDRLGHGCRDVPRVSGGRMFLNFNGDLLALDLYTGCELWRASGLWDRRLVAMPDGLYLPQGLTCLRLDPVTGSRIGRIDVPAEKKATWGTFRIWRDYFVGTAGKELLCLDRHSGKLLWDFQPERDGLSFAVGAGSAFVIEYWLPARRRRGEAQTEQATIYAFDLATGEVRWQKEVSTPAASKSDSPFGLYQPMAPQLAYCEASDVLVLTVNWSIRGAWRGTSGAVLWTKDIPCADPPSRWSAPQPPIVLQKLIITHGGQMVAPETGALLPKRLWRGINAGTRGCNRAVGCPHLVALRDADISYFDLATGRQTRLRGIRSGCTNGLLPAGGLLNAPNLAYHCSCNWPIFTSMALVHMPQAASWPPAAASAQ